MPFAGVGGGVGWSASLGGSGCYQALVLLSLHPFTRPVCFGFGIDRLQPHACATFNVLNQEDRAVAAAILPLDPVPMDPFAVPSLDDDA